ncbi:MAG: hypothetical protein U0P81_14820 [Holophagaceae bacterium]
MEVPTVEPWIPPPRPDLARLAMDVADELGTETLRAWPEARKGGIGFGDLPPFLSWHGLVEGQHHLVLLQPRELGALVPGARTAPLPARWLEDLDLESLARPLARHPAWGGAVASVHVVSVARAGEARVRTEGEPAPDVVAAVLDRVSEARVWSFSD